MSSLRALLLVLASLSLAHAEEQPPTRAASQAHFLRGQQLFGSARYGEALAEFEAGRALLASPSFDYNIGLCLERLDRPGAAAAAYERYLAARPGDPDAEAIWRQIRLLRAEAQARGPEPPPPRPAA